MNHTVYYRKATIEDIELLQYWDTKPHVMASIPDVSWNWDEELGRTLDWRELLIACIDERPIGFVQIIDPAVEETHYWGDVAQNLRAMDIWIGEEADLNKGYGNQMMRLAIERCFSSQNVSAIILDPLETNTSAQRFYERLGFELLELREFDGVPSKVYELTRENWSHLK